MSGDVGAAKAEALAEVVLATIREEVDHSDNCVCCPPLAEVIAARIVQARAECLIPCDTDCEATCHAAHLPRHKRVGESALREALSELVALKDGPRDAAYRATKEGAWDRARAALDPGQPR